MVCSSAFYGENEGTMNADLAENIKAELLMKANFSSSIYNHKTLGYKMHKWARAYKEAFHTLRSSILLMKSKKMRVHKDTIVILKNGYSYVTEKCTHRKMPLDWYLVLKCHC